MGEMAALAEGGNARVGEMMGAMGVAMDQTKSDDDTVKSSTGHDVALGGLRGFMGMMSAEKAHYTGVPIRVNGKIVATFCVLDRHRHRDDIDGDKVKALAARASEVFIKRAAAAKEKKETAAAARGNMRGGDVPRTSQTSAAGNVTSSNYPAAAAAAAAMAAASRGEVVELNDENFAAVALDPSVDVAVLLITPWCPHCAETKRAWAAAARSHAGSRGVPVFATFDVQRDDPPTPVRRHAEVWQATQVPSLVLAPRGAAAEPVKFGNCAAADVPAAMSWMLSKGVEFDVALPVMTEEPATPDTRAMVTANPRNNDNLIMGTGGEEDEPSPPRSCSTAFVPAAASRQLAVRAQDAGGKTGMTALQLPRWGSCTSRNSVFTRVLCKRLVSTLDTLTCFQSLLSNSSCAATPRDSGDSAYTGAPIVAVSTSGGPLRGGGGGGKFDADLFQLALSGLRQAESGGVQVLASWAATADSAAVGDGTAAQFPDFMKAMISAQSNAVEEHVALASVGRGGCTN
jgi:glutaredoxin